MKTPFYFPVATVLASSMFVSCLEEDESANIKDIEGKIEGQQFDIKRTQDFIKAGQVKLADFKQAAEDVEETESLQASLAKTLKLIEEGGLRNSEIADSVNLTELELEKYKRSYRVQARKDAIGKNIDLSATMGDEFKDVRLMAVNPLAVKVYMPSGPQTIPLRDLTPEVREMLQMSEEEAAAYLERKGESVAERAEKLKKWKESQADTSEDASKDAVLKRIKSLQEEIVKRENAINIRLQEMQGWKSKASNLELEASKERQKGKSNKMERYAELARDKALVLSDMNSDSWIVVGRLKAELEDLKRMGYR